MIISELKIKFQKELLSIYPKEEITSFFYLLTEYRLGLKRLDIALEPNTILKKDDERYFSNTINKLKKEIPVQYIIGSTEFFGLPFYVDPNVLIPRPETEELVEWVIKNTKEEREKNKALRILDVGTGSGCIAISLAKNIPKAMVWAMDVSDRALELAKKNAILNNLEIEFLKEDILKITSIQKLQKNKPRPITNGNKSASLLKDIGSPAYEDVKFDIIVSNPPYIRESEKQMIKNNVLMNEPHLALFVNNKDPLLFYDKIADVAKERLVQNGKLYFEINQYLGKETVELLHKKGFKNIVLRKDIFGNDRMIFSSFAP